MEAKKIIPNCSSVTEPRISLCLSLNLLFESDKTNALSIPNKANAANSTKINERTHKPYASMPMFLTIKGIENRVIRILIK